VFRGCPIRVVLIRFSSVVHDTPAKVSADVVLTLSGPKGADNVDPWRKITDSLWW
jgi:hypothetical protein